MFKYFNDEWNEKENTDDDINLSRMERRITGSFTGEEQKEVLPQT